MVIRMIILNFKERGTNVVSCSAFFIVNINGNLSAKMQDMFFNHLFIIIAF